MLKIVSGNKPKERKKYEREIKKYERELKETQRNEELQTMRVAIRVPDKLLVS